MATIRGWFDRGILSLLSGLATTLITLHAFATRSRMSHENGIVARGRVKLVDDPRFPSHPFFSSGREFPCRLRHASVSYQDDAALVVRGSALKFADTDFESPLDLLMNSGETAPFYDAWTFVQFMYLTVRGRNPHAVRYMKKYPLAARGVQVSLRRDPESFARMSYYSKTPFLFDAHDGVLRYVKFRLLPEHDGPESGIPDATSLQRPWEQQPLPGETRSQNYLKDEYRSRVEREGARYHLQLQLHQSDSGDLREVVLNASIAWDDETHPWYDLATVEIDEVLSYEDGNRSRFTPSNHPPSMGFIQPLSIHDPPSLDLLRQRGIWARRARLLGYRLFGMPAQSTDVRVNPAKIEHTAFVLPSSDTVLLPQNESAEGRRARQQELEAARGLYQWGGDPSLPPCVRSVPKKEQFSDEKDARLLWDLGATALDLGLGALERLAPRHHHAALDEFRWLYPIRPIPTVSQRFERDDEFGRQRLAGVNPVLIERCREIPDHFPVDDALVRGLLCEGDSLESAVAEGRLYLNDYRSIDGLPVKDGRYVSAPLCLLYVDASSRLVPIAIQLGQTPDVGPVFTPKDSRWLWLSAKTWVQAADAQYHESSSHLLRTHMVMEPFAVATARQLSTRHPVGALLRPHFHDTMAINHSARTSMLAPGGAIDQTMALGAEGSLEAAKRSYAEWRFDRYDLVTDLRTRGVDDSDLLPGYHYRDDALLVWAAIDEFVGAMIDCAYASNAVVAADPELREWARELASSEGGRVQGLPNGGVLRTRADLRQVVAQVIFTCSAEHASVNNGQYEMFGYPPNVPGAMYQPPPRSHEELSEEQFVKALPHRRAAAEQVGMVHLLSIPTHDPLGGYDSGFFIGNARVEALLADFRARLGAISAKIEQRNAGLEVPYTYLDPVKIGQSIAI